MRFDDKVAIVTRRLAGQAIGVDGGGVVRL